MLCQAYASLEASLAEAKAKYAAATEKADKRSAEIRRAGIAKETEQVQALGWVHCVCTVSIVFRLFVHMFSCFFEFALCAHHNPMGVSSQIFSSPYLNISRMEQSVGASYHLAQLTVECADA